jgi:hypothetical protein
MNPPPRFRCPICRCTSYETVRVSRPTGESRPTPFFSCCGCSVMFRDALAFAAFDPNRVTATQTPDPSRLWQNRNSGRSGR